MSNPLKDFYMEVYQDQAPSPIVCLCGSTRFKEAFEKANWEQTLAGKIVLQPGHYTHSIPGGGNKEDVLGLQVSAQLEALYFRKIDLADEILVLNVGGYLGESTKREVDYAYDLGKTVNWLEGPPKEYADLDPWEEHGRY